MPIYWPTPESKVSWCFEPSQPLEVTSGLNTTSNQSLSYSAHKSVNIDHNISTAQLFETHKISHISTKPKLFCITVEILLHIKSTLKYLILYKTYQSLSSSQTNSLDSHFGTVNAKISLQNISNLHQISTFYQDMFDCDNCIKWYINRRPFFFSKESNVGNMNDQYVVCLELCLLFLYYKMSTVYPKALVSCHEACWIL